MKQCILGLTLLLGCLASCSAPRGFQTLDPIGTIRSDPGHLVNAWGDSMAVSLGHLVVAEDREAASSPAIEIGYARIPAGRAGGRAPVFFLAGGPGISALEVARGPWFYFFREIARDRDLVLVDARGCGSSRPRLDCANALDLPVERTDDPRAALEQAYERAAVDCLQELRARGIDPAAYHSAALADDLDELRAELGYERIALVGVSYGTELAQLYEQRHPGRTERKILFGPVSPELSLKSPADVQRALSRLEEAGAEGLLARMERVHAQLRRSPQEIRIPRMDAVDGNDPALLRGLFRVISVFDSHYELWLSDELLQLMVQMELGGDASFDQLDRLYREMEAGQWRNVGNRLRNFRRTPMPNALLLTVNASTSAPRERLARTATEDATIGAWALSLTRTERFRAALGLPDRSADAVSTPQSEVPTLLVVGDLDARTPLENAAWIAARHRDATTFTVRGSGHHRLLQGESMHAALQFLDADEPSALACTVQPEIRASDVAASDSLRTLLVAADDAALRELLGRWVEDPDARAGLREAELNQLGYEFLAAQQVDRAQRILACNAQLFPASWNVWDSLAEVHRISGRPDEAIRLYRRSLELNPLNGNAHVALKELGARSG